MYSVKKVFSKYCLNNWKISAKGFEIKLNYTRLKLVRIKLETSTLAPKYTNICSFRKYTLLILLSAFFCKKSAFFDQSNTFPQSYSVRAVLHIF